MGTRRPPCSPSRAVATSSKSVPATSPPSSPLPAPPCCSARSAPNRPSTSPASRPSPSPRSRGPSTEPTPDVDARLVVTRPGAIVIAGPGTNRDTDAVLALDLAGAEPTVVLAAELTARPELLDAARIVVVAGGFSYGDALGAGRMLALDLTAADGGRLGERLRDFVAGGRPVIGICNGFQVLTRTGLLPGALGHNAAGRFDCRWVRLT